MFVITVVRSSPMFVYTSAFLSVPFTTTIHAGFILAKDTKTFAQFELKHELTSLIRRGV